MEPCGQARGPCGPTSFEPRLVTVPGRDVVSREEVQARLRMGWPAALATSNDTDYRHVLGIPDSHAGEESRRHRPRSRRRDIPIVGGRS